MDQALHLRAKGIVQEILRKNYEVDPSNLFDDFAMDCIVDHVLGTSDETKYNFSYAYRYNLVLAYFWEQPDAEKVASEIFEALGAK